MFSVLPMAAAVCAGEAGAQLAAANDGAAFPLPCGVVSPFRSAVKCRAAATEPKFHAALSWRSSAA